MPGWADGWLGGVSGWLGEKVAPVPPLHCCRGAATLPACLTPPPPPHHLSPGHPPPSSADPLPPLFNPPSLHTHTLPRSTPLPPLQAGSLRKHGFGSKAADDDEAALLWAPWRSVREAVQASEGLPEFTLRQLLFASQARVLLKLHRPAEVALRGLAFVEALRGLMGTREAAGTLPRHLKEAWCFAAALSLAVAASRMAGPRGDARRSDHGRSAAK